MMTRYTAPKTITRHPAVLECLSGEAGGSDYKHDVFLRPGWTFQNGRMAGTRQGFFHTVKSFLEADPKETA